MKKKILCRKVATELDEMSKVREEEFSPKDHGEPDALAPSSKRRRTATGDASATDSAATRTLGLPFSQSRDIASTIGLQVSFLMVFTLLTSP